jgi:hypothetical protein
LDEVGIVTVSVGVLENFLKTANASKGPEFLPIALEAKAHITAEAMQQAGRLLAAAEVANDINGVREPHQDDQKR